MKINGKKINCPRCYEELKTRHYIRIIKEWQPEEKDLYKKDFFKLFSILTDTDYKAFEKTPENEAAIWNSVRWFVEQPFRFEEKPPVMFQLGFKWLVVPKSVRVPKGTTGLSVGQNILIEQYCQGKFKEECIAFATAVCLQPLYDNARLDMDRVKDMEAILSEMPVHKVYPVGFFLLSLVEKHGRKHAKTYSQTKSNRIMASVRRLLDWHRLTSFRNGSITT